MENKTLIAHAPGSGFQEIKGVIWQFSLLEQVYLGDKIDFSKALNIHSVLSQKLCELKSATLFSMPEMKAVDSQLSMSLAHPQIDRGSPLQAGECKPPILSM